MHVTFKEFKGIMSIILNMDNLDRSLIDEYMNDWYSLYKSVRIGGGKWSVVQWAKGQFNDAEVNKDTHDFWLDSRGLELMYLAERIDKLSASDIFPVAK